MKIQTDKLNTGHKASTSKKYLARVSPSVKYNITIFVNLLAANKLFTKYYPAS
jgi:hypothetical protein